MHFIMFQPVCVSVCACMSGVHVRAFERACVCVCVFVCLCVRVSVRESDRERSKGRERERKVQVGACLLKPNLQLGCGAASGRMIMPRSVTGPGVRCGY